MAISSTSFKPGQSGNPKGRPAGARNRRQFLNEELMLSYLESGDGFRVMEVVKNQALEGHIPSATLFCKYVFFTPETAIAINDQREAHSNIANALTPDQIKAIAEITLNKNESE